MILNIPFYTKNEEDHKNSPVWHDNSECPEGKKILSENIAYGMKGSKCIFCERLDKDDKKSLWK